VTPEVDEALSTRLRDLALVDLDALLVGSREAESLLSAFAEDVADALGQARARIIQLRSTLGGADAFNILDATSRQRGSEAAGAGVERVRSRLTAQADAARALARLTDLAASLLPKLFEADRRRG
jgi:hypothetical protein